MGYESEKSEQEIEALREKASDNDGHYRGMSYEQGIADALEWVLGNYEGEPLSEL